MILWFSFFITTQHNASDILYSCCAQGLKNIRRHVGNKLFQRFVWRKLLSAPFVINVPFRQLHLDCKYRQRTSFPTSFIVNIWVPLINKLVVSFQCLLVGILQYAEHRVIFIHRIPTLMGYYYFIFVYYCLKWILVNVFRWPLWWKRCQLWPLIGQIWAGLVLPIEKWPKNVLLITNRIV